MTGPAVRDIQIERLWRFVKRKAAYGRYHPTFADFRAAVQDVLDRVPTTHAEKLASLGLLPVACQ